MRDAMVYFPIRDFETIRVCCHHADCRAVTELPIGTVEAVMKRTGGCCPVCRKPFTNPAVDGGADVVTAVAKAVLALNSLGSQVGLQFPASAT